jgi:RNA polymerase sigma-70 factor (ECF subfamily)
VNTAAVYSDQTLLSEIASGNEAAFTILFERYRNKLYYYLLRHTKSSEVAEELVTDIFMKLWNGRQMATDIIEIGAFLHKAAYFKVLDFLRTTARHSRLRQLYMSFMEHASDPGSEDLVIGSELKTILYKAINRLPPQRRLIYQLSRQEGLTHEEIAKTLGLSPSTINNALVKANHSILKVVKSYSSEGTALLLLLMGM